MIRKLAIATASMALLAGYGWADDEEDGPLEKSMSQIQTKTTALRNATRTAAAFKKDGKSIGKTTEEILKLAKESRDVKYYAEKQKKSFEEWQKLTDDMIKATEEMKKVAANAKTTQAEAKTAFNAFNKTCGACHTVFKPED